MTPKKFSTTQCWAMQLLWVQLSECSPLHSSLAAPACSCCNPSPLRLTILEGGHKLLAHRQGRLAEPSAQEGQTPTQGGLHSKYTHNSLRLLRCMVCNTRQLLQPFPVWCHPLPPALPSLLPSHLCFRASSALMRASGSQHSMRDSRSKPASVSVVPDPMEALMNRERSMEGTWGQGRGAGGDNTISMRAYWPHRYSSSQLTLLMLIILVVLCKGCMA